MEIGESGLIFLSFLPPPGFYGGLVSSLFVSLENDLRENDL